MHIQRVQLRVIADFKNAIKQVRIYLFFYMKKKKIVLKTGVRTPAKVSVKSV